MSPYYDSLVYEIDDTYIILQHEGRFYPAVMLEEDRCGSLAILFVTRIHKMPLIISEKSMNLAMRFLRRRRNGGLYVFAKPEKRVKLTKAAQQWLHYQRRLRYIKHRMVYTLEYYNLETLEGTTTKKSLQSTRQPHVQAMQFSSSGG